MTFDRNTLNGRTLLADERIEPYLSVAMGFGKCFSAKEIAKEHGKRMEVARSAASRAVRSVGSGKKVGVISVRGPIDQRFSAALMKAGGTSCEEIAAQLDALMGDSSVGAIVLDVDSPGGCSYGVEELSDKIYAARDRKPIYSIANSMACSAAYWIASAAGNMSCTPGGDCGSVGVYCVHIDQSEALANEGLKVTMISAAKYKGELSPHQPLSDESKAYVQESVNATYDAFLGALARNRGTTKGDVRANYGEGRVKNAADALASKMIDGVRTFDDLVASLTGGASGGGKSASMEVLRRREMEREREVA